jgi:predicted DNA-binding antitoxin AbrB/MazE fold protein
VKFLEREQRRNAMGGTIRARVKGGVLEPLERTDLPEGKEVLITVVSVAEDPDDEAFLRSAGSWKGLVDAEKLIRDIYEDRLIDTREEPKL